METAQVALWAVVMLVALAIAFDFMNGFHDAANSIATVVSTGVLRPTQAVVFAACFNLLAVAIFHLSVAATVGKGIVQPGVVDAHVVAGALTGAVAWNLITWYYGIPSSSSHALIGGIVGAATAKAGAGVLLAAGALSIVIAAQLVRPMRRLFVTHQALGSADLVGQTCKVLTGVVDARQGRAEVARAGASINIRVWAQSRHSFSKGDLALITQYDAASHRYLIEPLS